MYIAIDSFQFQIITRDGAFATSIRGKSAAIHARIMPEDHDDDEAVVFFHTTLPLR
jgi:hypothetical protein